MGLIEVTKVESLYFSVNCSLSNWPGSSMSQGLAHQTVGNQGKQILQIQKVIQVVDKCILVITLM